MGLELTNYIRVDYKQKETKDVLLTTGPKPVIGVSHKTGKFSSNDHVWSYQKEKWNTKHQEKFFFI